MVGWFDHLSHSYQLLAITRELIIVGLTVAMQAARKERTGSMVPTTSVSFQLRKKAMRNPAMKVVKY